MTSKELKDMWADLWPSLALGTVGLLGLSCGVISTEGNWIFLTIGCASSGIGLLCIGLGFMRVLSSPESTRPVRPSK